MESRPLRYFVAVAEELNFTRAAERLGISAPPLSRAIRKLEKEMGVALFDRNTHGVALSPAGAVLLAEAKIVLDALQAAERRAQRAAATEPKLILAVKADGDAGLLEPILARFASEPAAIPVAVRLCGWHEQPRLLRQGEADAALVHEPCDRTGLDAETLIREPRVAALAASHPLAARDQLTLTDLDLRPDEVDQFINQHRGQGRDLAQLLTLVGLGGPTPLLPASVAARYPRPGVVYRPVADAPLSVLTIAWPQQSRSTATAALVRAACSVADVVRGSAATS
ncbi:LysR family transcriptional regulator [Streptomyces sp. NPDC093228]|uniref:LysR family transcriptional regulator n=1 Tax=unclassified Streptomyces TaxID=2593676 RepID=UPI000741366B|nr:MULTISPECIES: LysR family transcriptional regulator [unclassified Streptomyces]KUJ35973.1 LysR family transcriptional regulator [Streptomyces sp. NRRL F-5122]MDX3262073.1 LysR family transcriptional regulator [Streptomyces sp. MI02-2A]REE65877.1 LysR family transcriptional regulator [Streptomyces sp. 3212.3]